MKFTLETLEPLIGSRAVYIYAANLEGAGYCALLSKRNCNVVGFVDSRNFDGGKKKGKPVIHPDTFFAELDPGQAFVLIATKHRATIRQAIRQCEQAGLVRDVTFIIGTELCEFLPTIEVVGACNLRCLSCNMGLPETEPGGRMSPDTYRQVLLKMIREIPFMNSVCLYLWGEPFLHPQLPEILRITSECGVASDVSTNLNYGRHLEAIIEAGPDLLTVPCSGIYDNYGRTHTGGSWEVYKGNLYRLRECIDKFRADTTVRIVFHMYKHNLEEDYDAVYGIAEDLGFYFFPIQANIFPEKVYEYAVHGTPLPANMQKTNEMLLIPMEEQLQYAHDHRHLFCPVRKAFPTVRWDLSVLQCCNRTAPTVHRNYLEVSLDELMQLRGDSPTCALCMEEGIHRFFDVNATVSVVDGRRVVTRK